MLPRPDVVVLDVNQTLSDTAPLADRFTDVGAPGHLAATWFGAVLRDGFGLAAAGAFQPFPEVAAGVLRTVLAEAGVADLDGGVQHVLDGMQALDVHPDVPPGLQLLADAGLRLVSLTNGAAGSAEALLERAGVRHLLEHVLSVDDAGAWKPARAAYEHALRTCGVAADRAVLTAVHPWDVDGAARAGLQTAWVDRTGTPYPTHLLPPDRTGSSLVAVAALLRPS